MEKTRSRLVCLLIALMMLIYLPTSISAQSVLYQTSPPAESDIAVYNYTGENGAVVYVNRITEPGTVVRVYDGDGNLLGEAGRNSLLNIACVPLKSYSTTGGEVFVTRQDSGMLESESTSVEYDRARTPRVEFVVQRIDDPTLEMSTPEFFGSYIYDHREIKAGTYYMVNVTLRFFNKVSEITLPLKYDTETLDLMGVESRSGKYYLSDTPVSESSPESLEGLNFDYSVTNPNKYGVMKGTDVSGWGDFASMAAASPDPDTGEGNSYRGEYQYINTQTGLIKVNAGSKTAGELSSGSSVLRIFFRAKQNGSEYGIDPIIRFATADDYDEENGSGKFMDRRKYYDVGNPAGASVTLWGVNLLMSPMAAEYGESVSEEEPLKLLGEDVEELPQNLDSIAKALLPPNTLKIHNFTNYTESGQSLGTLDGYINDMLVLRPASGSDSGTATGTLKSGDVVRVYANETDDTAMFSGEASGDGEVRISLGTGFLQKEGGTIYITNSRNNQESVRLPFEYPPEMNRKVRFEVYSSTMNSGNDGADIAKYPGSLYVQKGDRISVKVYFEDINELMAYTFPIHFDPLVVRAADADFNELPSGAVLEEDNAGFLDGTDIEPLSFDELLIYYAETESEIEGLLESMAIDRATFDAIKAEATAKMEGETPWEGGILYTGERGEGVESTAYPYVDNENGLLKISAISLVPSGILEQEGGYHFLTLNFIAKYSGVPNFRFATENDEYHDKTMPDGGTLHIVGTETQMQSVGMTTTWTAHWQEGLSSVIDLSGGNALPGDITLFADPPYEFNSDTQFVYYKYKFRDPGIMVYLPSGGTASDEDLAANLKRYYIVDGQKTELPPWQSNEVLPTDAADTSGSTAEEGKTYFGMSSEDYSKVYDLMYEYTVPGHYDEENNPLVLTASRKVVMIYRLGDFDRDGTIGPLDLSTIKDHQGRVILLDLTDLLYKAKTANTGRTSDNSVGATALSAMKDHQAKVNSIVQDYLTDSNNIMIN